MAAFNKFNAFVEDVFEKVHNMGADTLKVLFTNVAPVAANAVKADLTEITAGNGYAAGGPQAVQSSSAQAGGTYKLVVGDVTVTATGSVGPFRYAVLWNSTPGAGPLVGWYDYGSSITLNAGEPFTVDFDATNGVLQAA